ncbi:uncharacterized protein LY79DRAFT_118461 [Colletotrichum navitas]|uniref:Uncharacterized protein n=1 Tax=Colletotrichum navitas TaxID=681940 RepID=A0AAD8Q413_9PEZI|nr:uncharacterized protein LY79DRAFT_118461 [Colletotrichum navitas]KAK1595078.1 hypothetical protein LY79DRAFT_118461 [Colletotrichum navitas]
MDQRLNRRGCPLGWLVDRPYDPPPLPSSRWHPLPLWWYCEPPQCHSHSVTSRCHRRLSGLCESGRLPHPASLWFFRPRASDGWQAPFPEIALRQENTPKPHVRSATSFRDRAIIGFTENRPAEIRWSYIEGPAGYAYILTYSVHYTHGGALRWRQGFQRKPPPVVSLRVVSGAGCHNGLGVHLI